MPTHFNQGCPVCGRRLRVPVQLLGKQVCCQHCGQEMLATSDDSEQQTSINLRKRVDRLLARSKQFANSR